jgi:hypothetical protein
MAQTAKTEAEKAANTAQDAAGNVAELGKRAAAKTADAAREAVGTTENLAREGFQAARRATGAALEVERAVARRSAEGTAELGQALIELVNEQTRHNVEVFKALTRTVDWNEVAQIQGEFVRVSLERAAQLTQCYLEVTQAVITSAASAAKDQASKAA